MGTFEKLKINKSKKDNEIDLITLDSNLNGHS